MEGERPPGLGDRTSTHHTRVTSVTRVTSTLTSSCSGHTFVTNRHDIHCKTMIKRLFKLLSYLSLKLAEACGQLCEWVSLIVLIDHLWDDRWLGLGYGLRRGLKRC